MTNQLSADEADAWLSNILEDDPRLNISVLDLKLATICSEDLKPVAEAFRKNIDVSDEVTFLPFMVASYSELLRRQAKVTEIRVKREDIEKQQQKIKELIQLANTKLNSSHDDHNSMKEDIQILVTETKQLSVDLAHLTESIRDIRDTPQKTAFHVTAIKPVISNLPGIIDTIEKTLLFGVSSFWSCFEILAKDLWEVCVNIKPNPHAYDTDTKKDAAGIYKKKIDLDLLKRYDFNVSNKLGTILKSKFDPWGVNEIISAFQSVVCSDLNMTAFKDTLFYIEECRHLIQHRAGVIDQKFVTRFPSTNQKGQRLVFNRNEVVNLGSSIVEAGIILIEKADVYLQNNQ